MTIIEGIEKEVARKKTTSYIEFCSWLTRNILIEHEGRWFSNERFNYFKIVADVYLINPSTKEVKWLSVETEPQVNGTNFVQLWNDFDATIAANALKHSDLFSTINEPPPRVLIDKLRQ